MLLRAADPKAILKTPQRPDYVLREPVVTLSASDDLSACDELDCRQILEHIGIFGGSGSGKTTTSFAAILRGMMAIGAGGFFFTTKGDDGDFYEGLAKEAGRQQDFIRFSLDSGDRFDFLKYEFGRPGRGAADQEAILEVLNIMTEITGVSAASSKEPFWQLMKSKLIRHSVTLLSIARMDVSVENIDRIIGSLPTHPNQFDDAEYQRTAFTPEVFRAIRYRDEPLTAIEWSDLDYISRFIGEQWPAFDERPRGSVVMEWSAAADMLMFGDFRVVFASGGVTVVPELATQAGKIICWDIPILEYRDKGKLAQGVIKACCINAILRRNVKKHPFPVFLACDEFQMHLLPRGLDNRLLQLGRGFRGAFIGATQNLMNIAEKLDESTPGSKTKSLLANIGTKIFHQQNCFDTNTYAADLIGKEYTAINSSSTGDKSVSVSENVHLEYRVLPDQFSRLLRPDDEFPFAECVVYSGGRLFTTMKNDLHPEGRNFLVTRFRR